MDSISRMERILSGEALEPITRIEKFCAMAAGTYTGDPLVPTSRLEYFLSQISGGGGGGGDIKISRLFKPAAYNGEYMEFSDTTQIATPEEGYSFNEVKVSDQYISVLCFSGVLKCFYIGTGQLNTAGRYTSYSRLQTLLYRGSSPISASALANDTNLENLILYSDSVLPLANINAFTNTPFASGKTGGTLWVPQALIESYQTAANWSVILGYTNNRISALEGSVYE